MVETLSRILIDLNAIRSNVTFLLSRLQMGTRMWVTVKADAYGHGMLPISHTVMEAGAYGVAVATAEDALLLREAGFAAPVLVIGPLNNLEQCAELAMHDVEFTVVNDYLAAMLPSLRGLKAKHSRMFIRDRGADRGWDTDLDTFSDPGNTNDSSCYPKMRARIHLKVNTGMNWQGLTASQVEDFLVSIRHIPEIELVGVMTHFTRIPEDSSSLDQQLERFLPIVERVRQEWPQVLAHAACSAATICAPHSHLDMVRCGEAVYGLASWHDDIPTKGLKPALTWISQVTHIRHVQLGEMVGYGEAFCPQKETKVAIVPVGYADGLNRALGGRGEVLIKGKRYSLVGCIAMNYCIVEVGRDSQVRVGDMVTILGADGEDHISAEEIARHLGTINCEVVSALSLSKGARQYMSCVPGMGGDLVVKVHHCLGSRNC